MTKPYMIFHAGTGTYFGLTDPDVYVIDPDNITDEEWDEIDGCGEIPESVIDSDRATRWAEFVSQQLTVVEEPK